MIQYISKKIILMLSVFFVVVSVTFFIAHMLPGDPVSLWVGEHPTKEQIEAAQKELGFDKPKIIQFSKFVKNLFKIIVGEKFEKEFLRPFVSYNGNIQYKDKI